MSTVRHIKIMALCVLCAFALATSAGAQNEYEVQGNWQGEVDGWSGHSLHAQVVALGGGNFRAVLFLDTTFPENHRTEIKGKTQKNVVYWTGDATFPDMGTFTVKAETRFTGKGADKKGELAGTFTKDGKSSVFTLNKTYIQSPTLGQDPPAGAKVLIPKDLKPGMDDLVNENWERGYRWAINNEGALVSSGSSLIAKYEYQDALIHVEFSTPFEPNDRGQARGNSGCYVHGRYEVQVLDSFGDPPADNLCGGIYQQLVPRICAALPPGEWQTYDITFIAPKFDANGQKTANAILTIVHNGETIHDQRELKHPTPGGLGGKEAPLGRMLLQDHTDNGLRYRNVWIKPLN